MVLSAAELTGIRAEMDATLPATCAIHRATRTPNDSGGWSDAFAEVQSVACRISPLSQTETIIAGRIAAESTHIVRLPALTDVRAGDQIVEFSVVYEVTGPASSRSEELIRGAFCKVVS